MDPKPIASSYDPASVERLWFRRWEAAGLFKADSKSSSPAFCICLPPPNITGELHMGHAVNATLQDILARYKRMNGYEVLFLPGTDHAAIATQNVIERQLTKDGTSKEQTGREAFRSRVDRWYREIGNVILSQLQDLGISLDFSRTRFTMDPNYVRAVRTAFVYFFEKGWIYRGPRLVNWCPRCRSAISDLEVEWKKRQGELYFIKYEVEGEQSVTVATVRPETMLGDTAVAVHPEDGRFSSLVGRFAILPLVGRRLPIISDRSVDSAFGSGVLKVTPAHDPLDYEIAERHGLEALTVIDEEGKMKIVDHPAYHGLSTKRARQRVVEDLRRVGALVRTEPYEFQLGHCDRCGTSIEPRISEQWFLSMKELGARAIEAVKSGEVSWHPNRYERTFLDWMEGLKDWCISRQLWLGHEIPVYTCSSGHIFASVDQPTSCKFCGSSDLTPDPDVLDTWFSSALWPFATLGWPEDTADLRKFYPNSMNSTDRQIINLWVSRMIACGLEFMEDAPFKDVLIHATVQTRDGKRMSKSLGNAVDPRDIARQYGADALRAWAASIGMSSQDVRFDDSRILDFRRFGNKLWNAFRLLEPNLRTGTPVDLGVERLEDRWILSRLQWAIEHATDGIEQFRFHQAINSLYEFLWHEYCDWYLEAIKPRLRAEDPRAGLVATYVLEVTLRLLHPFMPFLTEELWSYLPGSRKFLVKETWPLSTRSFTDSQAEQIFLRLQTIVEEIRKVRREQGRHHRGGRVRVDEELDRDLLGLLATLGAVEFADLAGGIEARTFRGCMEFTTVEEGKHV